MSALGLIVFMVVAGCVLGGVACAIDELIRIR
jgi:hypothetical protein